MDDTYKDFGEYNPNEKRKVLVVKFLLENLIKQ